MYGLGLVTDSGYLTLVLQGPNYCNNSGRDRGRDNRTLALLKTWLGGAKFLLEVCLLRVRLKKSALLQERNADK